MIMKMETGKTMTGDTREISGFAEPHKRKGDSYVYHKEGRKDRYFR